MAKCLFSHEFVHMRSEGKERGTGYEGIATMKLGDRVSCEGSLVRSNGLRDSLGERYNLAFPPQVLFDEHQSNNPTTRGPISTESDDNEVTRPQGVSSPVLKDCASACCGCQINKARRFSP